MNQWVASATATAKAPIAAVIQATWPLWIRPRAAWVRSAARRRRRGRAPAGAGRGPGRRRGRRSRPGPGRRSAAPSPLDLLDLLVRLDRPAAEAPHPRRAGGDVYEHRPGDENDGGGG